jgi:hypothetical protein
MSHSVIGYDAPDHSWIPEDHHSENPQIRLAGYNDIDPITPMETDLAHDYNVNESLDYSDSNLSICMATMTPFSDSIVIPVTINGQEVLALVDTGATHNFITPTTALKLGLTTTPPEGTSKSIQVASTQLVPRMGSCNQVNVTLAPISENSECRMIVTSFELLVLGQNAPSIILAQD